MYAKQLQCVHCQKQYPYHDDLQLCPACLDETGILDIIYDYQAIKQHWSKETLNQTKTTSILRYLPLLPIKGTERDAILHVGMSPLYHSRHQPRLWLKDDALNPSASLKDRASVIATMHAKEQGHDNIACSSTGNAASSLAAHAAKLGLKAHIFVPKRAPSGKLSQLLAYGVNLYKINGNYEQTYHISKAAIHAFKWYNRNAAVNPVMVEGKKTVAFEIIEQLQFNIPDWVIISVGDGCSIAGVYKGFKEFKTLGFIDKIPKICGVQSDGCAPFYHAWHHNQPFEKTEENTLADSIAVGVPRNAVKGMQAVKQTGGIFITVSDQAIMAAIFKLAKEEGIYAEPAAAAAYAGYIKATASNLIKSHETSVVIITGSGLKDPDAMQGLVQKLPLIDPNINAIIKRIKEKEVKQDDT